MKRQTRETMKTWIITSYHRGASPAQRAVLRREYPTADAARLAAEEVGLVNAKIVEGFWAF